MGKMVGGGVEAVVLNYCQNMDQNLFKFDFLIDEDSTYVPRDEIEMFGGSIIKVPPYQRLGAYSREMYQVLRKGQYDVVHSHLNALSVFPLRMAKKVEVPVRIAHSHSTSGKGEFGRNIIKNLLKPFSSKYATHLFACSEHAGRWLFGNRQFEVVNNGIDLRSFSFDPESRKSLREDFGVEEGVLLVGSVGRFVKQKNQSFFLDFLQKATADNINMYVCFVGDGPMRKKIENMADALHVGDRCIFAGQRRDIAKIYSAFDVFLLPSLYEGFGMVALEAQKSGLPCVLSDAVPRDVAVSDSCIFHSTNDVDAWVDDIRHLSSKARCAAKHAPGFDPYDITLCAKRLEREYLRAVNKETGVL